MLLAPCSPLVLASHQLKTLSQNACSRPPPKMHAPTCTYAWLWRGVRMCSSAAHGAWLGWWWHRLTACTRGPLQAAPAPPATGNTDSLHCSGQGGQGTHSCRPLYATNTLSVCWGLSRLGGVGTWAQAGTWTFESMSSCSCALGTASPAGEGGWGRGRGRAQRGVRARAVVCPRCGACWAPCHMQGREHPPYYRFDKQLHCCSLGQQPGAFSCSLAHWLTSCSLAHSPASLVVNRSPTCSR